LIGFADSCHALRQQSRVVSEQPSAYGDSETKEQNQEGPSRRPDDGARREKQGQREDHKRTDDFCR
jgi:hypothetical protein